MFPHPPPTIIKIETEARPISEKDISLTVQSNGSIGLGKFETILTRACRHTRTNNKLPSRKASIMQSIAICWIAHTDLGKITELFIQRNSR